MNFLDLCAGIGGFSLGLERAGMTCAGQVEIDEYCNRVLAKHWPHVPRWGDITTLDPSCLPAVELVGGGYPCQPFSVAGKRKGAGDDRHLWPYIRKIVAHIRPTWCLFENVAGHVTMGLDAVLSDLENDGYPAWPLAIPACAINSKDRRGRIWILAHTASDRFQGGKIQPTERLYQKTGTDEQLAGFLLTGDRASVSIARTYRSGHGVPKGTHRNRVLGNAVKPQMAFEFGRAIMAAHHGLEA